MSKRLRIEHMSLWWVLLLSCGEEIEGEQLVESSESVVASVSCEEREEVGYDRGAATPIRVVTVDGRPVEVETANAFLVMRDVAEAEDVSIRVLSGFRSNDQQTYLYHCYVTCSCNSCNLAARPGYSNHQNGHALDLYASSRVVSWMRANGARFGFRETVRGEPWHWEWWGGGPGGGPCTSAPPPPPSPSPEGCGWLGVDRSLQPGELLRSCNGRYVFVHQHDGNVVLYDEPAGRALFHTRTHGRTSQILVMQGDGNLVLYGAGAMWASGTDGHPGSALAVQDDGNVVIYAPGGRPIWATHTER